MHKAVKNPRDIPMDNFGNKIPMAPPTKELVNTRIPSITPNSFIEGSMLRFIMMKLNEFI